MTVLVSVPVSQLYNSQYAVASLSLFYPSRRQDGRGARTVRAENTKMDSLRSLVRVRAISEKCRVQVISILSMVTCLATIITYLIILRDPGAWDQVADYVLHWMVDNNLDVTVRLIKHREGKGSSMDYDDFPNLILMKHLLQTMLIWVIIDNYLM